MRRLHKPRRSLIIIGVVMSLLVLGWLVFWHQAASTHSNNQLVPPTKHTAPPLTASGTPVPPAFQDKARQLGYYCPSWNAKPGQVAPDICLPLDK